MLIGIELDFSTFVLKNLQTKTKILNSNHSAQDLLIS